MLFQKLARTCRATTYGLAQSLLFLMLKLFVGTRMLAFSDVQAYMDESLTL
jgi:hypothetical protein